MGVPADHQVARVLVQIGRHAFCVAWRITADVAHVYTDPLYFKIEQGG